MRVLVFAIGLLALVFPEEVPAIELSDFSDSLAEVVERVRPAVVEVQVRSLAAAVPEAAAPGGAPAVPTVQQSGGSGVVVDADGWILTGAHVVEGATRVEVVLASPPRKKSGSVVRRRGARLAARVVGVDRETDIAVLHVEASNLPTVPFADSQLARPGQIVLAVGSPHGLYESVTMGIVSAIGRQRTPDDPMVFLQTDTPINPGNSGGPLIDTKGRLLGISSFILTQSGGNQGLGFVVPSNIARVVYEQILEHGRVRRGTIGVVVQTITPEIARGLGLEEAHGALVADVLPGSPAEKTGLAAGDVVVELDGHEIENARQFEVGIYRHPIGEAVDLNILRDGQGSKKRVTVAEREESEPTDLLRLVNPGRDLVPELGAMLLETNAEVEAALPPLRAAGGLVVVTADAPRGPVDSALLPGDIVVALGRTPVTTHASLRVALTRLEQESSLVLRVQRGPQFLYVPRERRGAPAS